MLTLDERLLHWSKWHVCVKISLSGFRDSLRIGCDNGIRHHPFREAADSHWYDSTLVVHHHAMHILSISNLYESRMQVVLDDHCTSAQIPATRFYTTCLSSSTPTKRCPAHFRWLWWYINLAILSSRSLMKSYCWALEGKPFISVPPKEPCHIFVTWASRCQNMRSLAA